MEYISVSHSDEEFFDSDADPDYEITDADRQCEKLDLEEGALAHKKVNFIIFIVRDLIFSRLSSNIVLLKSLKVLHKTFTRFSKMDR